MRKFLILFSPLLISIAHAMDTLPANARQELQLTIYNQDTALIEDRRSLILKGGENEFQIEGISPQLRPETVAIDGIPVIESHFIPAQPSLEKFYASYIGQELPYIETNAAGEEKIQKATLLAMVGGSPVLKIGDRVELQAPGRLVFPAIPEGFRTEAMLAIKLKTDKAGETPLRLTYLSRRFSWNADYVGVLSKDEKRLSLNGYASVQNNSGMNFRKVKLRLVAGKVETDTNGPLPLQRPAAPLAAATAKFLEQPAQDLHLYTLPDLVDLEEGEFKQLALISSTLVPVEKLYRIDNLSRFPDEVATEEENFVHARLALRFKNDKESGLGEALPSGTMRVYSQNSDGALFMGENILGDIPENQSAQIELGEAFDVTAKTRQVSFEKNGNVMEAAREVTFSNAKEDPVIVTLTEQVPGEWKMLSESEMHESPSANIALWRVTVPAHAEKKLTYKVRFSYP